MSTNPENFRPRLSGDSRQYLEADIRNASPARLRLMMIERGVETAALVADRWRNQQSLGSSELTLKLFDLLNELLS
ncbi:MAG: flagellar protein FliS, partial [Pirellulales bacterium]|nr:flagellar protein FliS [Pirellulales bacterium]